ncbi:MAG: twin-arginine translocation signal domain-containing protein, partial [Planctomycetaceae bacterium]|nr:twin-arginine translocation signal domain-containing protein [Planctomycetaceae bacterium]
MKRRDFLGMAALSAGTLTLSTVNTASAQETTEPV